MRPVFMLLLVTTVACRGREATVRVTIPDLDGTETPVPGLVVTFLPYDRDSVITSLEERADLPRPHTEELDSLYERFQAPFTHLVRLQAAEARLGRERDSLRPSSADQQRLAQVEDSLARLGPAIATARAALEEARRRYWPAIDTLRVGVQRWREVAYGGYDTLVRALPGRRMANPVADTTNATGYATAEITRGRWWVTAQSVDPTDPYAEWYWNLPVAGDTVLLNSHTGRRRPRY